MSYSDFELLQVSAFGPGTLLGTSGSGLPVLNTNLIPALSGTNVGNFCRYNRIDGGGSIDVCNLFSIKNTVQSGSFVNIPSTKGVEMIFSARGTFNSAFGNGTSVGVFCKNVNLSRGSAEPGTGYFTGGENIHGYGLRLSNLLNYGKSQTSLHIGLWARNGNSGLQEVVTSLPSGLGTVSYDTWYTMKLTVIPTGNIQDVLKAYILTGSNLNTDFVEIASLSIPNTSTFYWPWTSATSRNGFYYSRGSNTNSGGANQAGHAWYLDRFSCKIKNIT